MTGVPLTGAPMTGAPMTGVPLTGAPMTGAPLTAPVHAPAGRHHILTVLVENKAGVLARVAGLFSRRGFNIFSLAVAPTDDDRFSRITIVVDVESAPLEQVVHQLDKLVNVVSISELAPGAAVQRELLLATVEAEPDERSQVIQLVGVYGGEVVDVGATRLTVMLAGQPETLDGFEGLLEGYSVVGIQRTGLVALPKLDRRPPARAPKGARGALAPVAQGAVAAG